MADKTIIAWTDHTFNIAWGCQKISPGCAHCYADTLSQRYGHSVWGPGQPRRTFGAKHWAEPVKWGREGSARVFTSSMCDVFEDHATIAQELAKLWPLIRATPNLDWQILTKRADRIASNLPEDWGQGYPNVWLGVSIEDQEHAWRADILRTIPASVRFVSYEPALGPLTLDLTGLHWIIVGGESGPKYRTMDHEWARAMRDACRAAGVAFFFKQSSAARTEMGTTLDGETVREWPRERAEASTDQTKALAGQPGEATAQTI